ncbi:MAG TPA: phosphoribosylanthranilate isomerase [Steroidobacteraceae bacterium]|nr:phosphoribosylanthranilate isomerase [Steroidobacteraceae bacterium]
MIEARPTGTWIKICGMTTPEAVDAALAARVDAIGFVFSPSPRQLTPEAAVRLAGPARGRTLCVAVTRHPDQALLDEILARFAPDLWQSDREDVAALRAPASLSVLPVLRSGAPTGRSSSRSAALPPRLLYEGPVSGAGEVCDWSSARELARRTELILAGGLTAESVAAAIAAVEPFGVDVSSGVESQLGIKSAEKIKRFAEAARASFGAPRRARVLKQENLR